MSTVKEKAVKPPNVRVVIDNVGGTSSSESTAYVYLDGKLIVEIEAEIGSVLGADMGSYPIVILKHK